MIRELSGEAMCLALDLHKLTPQMRPAEGERAGQRVRTRLPGHGLVGLITIAVDDAAIASEQSQAINCAAARCIGINAPGGSGPAQGLSSRDSAQK